MAKPRTVPPGGIIYLRDVPTRYAYTPGESGTPHYVQASPAEHIFGALALGLKPLTEDVIGQVAGQMNAPVNRTAGDVSAAGSDLSDSFRGTTSALNVPGANAGSSVNGAIGQGTGAIGGAMSALQSALGGH